MLSTNHSGAALVMPRLDAKDWTSADYRDTVFRLIDRGVRCFGVFLGTLEETAVMLQDLQIRAGNRLIFAADYEYGLPMRLSGGIAMPRAMALGRGTVENTEKVAAAIACEMRALGVHWNWAPVADINSESHNPVINIRAFGESADTVASHVKAWVRGTQQEHIAACLKHVPGHGATVVDSHRDLPTITVSGERASRREFVPFRSGIEEQVASVMVAHLHVPFLDSKRPSSLSPSVVNGLIRDTWKYNGVIITDALDMGAITSRYNSGMATVQAIKAGNDVALMPADPNEAIDALQKAIFRGEISQQRIVASLERIEQIAVLHKQWPRSTTVDQSAHAQLALQSALTAITTEGDAALLPLDKFSHAAVFGIVGDQESATATQWFQYLAQATEMNIDFGYINGTATNEEVQALRNGVKAADVLVFGVFAAGGAFRDITPGFDQLPRIITELATEKPVVIVSCGSPYDIDILPSNLTIYAYSDTIPSLAASVLTLVGKR